MNKPWMFPESKLSPEVLLQAVPAETWMEIFKTMAELYPNSEARSSFDKLKTYTASEIAAMFDPENPVEDPELFERLTNLFTGLYYEARGWDVSLPGVIMQDIWDAVDGEMMKRGLVFWYYGYMQKDNPLFLARKADRSFPLNPDNFRKGIPGNVNPSMGPSPSYWDLWDRKGNDQFDQGALGWSKKQLANAIIDSGLADRLRLPWESEAVIDAPQIDRRLLPPMIRGLGLPRRIRDIWKTTIAFDFIDRNLLYKIMDFRWNNLSDEVKRQIPEKIALEMQRVRKLSDLFESDQELVDEIPVRRISLDALRIERPKESKISNYLPGFGHSGVTTGRTENNPTIYYAKIYQRLLDIGRNATPQQVLKWNIVPRERLMEILLSYPEGRRLPEKELAEMSYEDLLWSTRKVVQW